MRPALQRTIIPLVALAVALMPPMAAAQAPGSGLLEATMSLRLELPVANLDYLYPNNTAVVPVANQPLSTGSCGSNLFTPLPEFAAFKFRESPQQNGCGEASYALTIPDGARALRVTFEADRLVLETTDTNLPRDMIQELRIYDENRSLVAARQYFDRSDGERTERVPFQYQEPLRPGQSSATVSWFFHDVGEAYGQALVNPIFGQGLSSTVTAPIVEIEGIPATVLGTRTHRGGVVEGSVQSTMTFKIEVPQGHLVGATADLRLHLDPGLTFQGARGPDGMPVPDERVRIQEAEGILELIVAGADANGGAYDLSFTSLRPLRPSPALYPLAIATLAAPAFAAAIAYGSARRLDREAPPEFGATGRMLRGLLVLFVVGYGLFALWILFRGTLPLMASWPLEVEAGVAYGVLALILAALLTLAILWRRHLFTFVQAEMEQRGRANQELERSNRELAQFAYVASHDLQEPLRMVASYTELLRRRYAGKLGADADEFIGYAVDGAERMQVLINDLLTYSRVGTQTKAFTPVNLGKSLDAALGNLQLAIQDADAQIERGPLPTVNADATQMVQLFQNLISNAIKFRRGPKPKIRIAARDAGDEWIVSITDDGIGIDPAHFDKLFVIFQRLGDRDATSGTGIGLAVCKRIAERHRGRITVASKPGQGSTFHVTFPKDNQTPRP